MSNYRFKTLAEETTYKFKDAAINPLEIEFEAARNTNMAAVHVENLYTYITRGVLRQGTLQGGGSIPVPTAPVLSGVCLTAVSISLSWVPGRFAEYYKLFRKLLIGGTYAAIGGDANNKIYTASYIDTGLSANTQYEYKVIAYNDNGNTASNEKIIKTVAITSAADVYRRNLPMNLNGYRCYVKIEQIADDPNFLWLNCDVEAVAITGRFA